MSKSASSKSNRLNARNPEDARIIVGELTSALDKARLRKRAEQACTECSKHHRKCETEEGKPRCKRCEKINIDCSFSARVSPSDHDNDESQTARGYSSTRGAHRSSSSTTAAPAAASGGYGHSVDPRHGYADPRYGSAQQPTNVYPAVASQYQQPEQYAAYNSGSPQGWSGNVGVNPQVQSGAMQSWPVQQQQHHGVAAAQMPYNPGHGQAYQTQPSPVQQRYINEDGTYYPDQQVDPLTMRYPSHGQNYGQYIQQTASGGNQVMSYHYPQ